MRWFWQNREGMSFSLNSLYESLGVSKQSFHQHLLRHDRKQEEKAYLWELMLQLREDHPMMGARTMYDKLQPEEIGRDAFIDLYNCAGLRVRRQRNYRRTTDSRGVHRFANLMEGWELTGVNQAYCSDITYYELNGKFYYLTFVMDQYSRRIVGWSASRTLRTEDTVIPCMRQLFLRLRDKNQPIFHSDGGGQYYSKAFLQLTRGRLRNSMGKSAYENPKAERLNGTIKNDYLAGYHPQDFHQLKSMLNKAVKMYNYERPHRELNKLSPVDFEQVTKQQRKILHQPRGTNKELDLSLTNLTKTVNAI